MKTILTKDRKIRKVLETCEPSYAENIGIITQGTRGVPESSPVVGTSADFDWVEALNNPEKDWYLLAKRAANWPTCACGNMCAIIPRDYTGCPNDSTLYDLGMSFYNQIVLKNTKEALIVLQQIEIRSAELIRDIKAEQKSIKKSKKII